MKKKIRNFFTLSRRANGGFTLVELIVVIAILAILAGVGVPAYSGYIKRANKGADQQLIGEVIHALELYAYSNPNVTQIAVVLDQEGEAQTVIAKSDETAVAEAMEAVFGAGWQSVGLKYADWKGESSALSYKESSYYGKESSLIQTVDKLTGALGDVVEKDKNMGNTLIGGQFETFLKDNKVNTDEGKAVGNAAVLYVANQTQGKEQEIKDAFAAGLAATGNPVNNVYAELYKTGIGEAASLAAIYAYAEGFAQSTGQADSFHANTDFSSVTDAASALNALGASFGALDTTGFDTYKGDQGGKDLQGYIDMMGTVNKNEDIVSGNLNSADCFTDGTVETMLKGHATMADLAITTADGQVAVIVYVDADGMIQSHVTPMNWNK
ncbi:MAG: prepilin-type N-terminal cleavage/methylation domain-containing protein [Oscillospiraceae bacterium]|nr:prepilin-type N-terminal cleavage/methylation domain-containing protein [Oscillospiraceae bacterium]